MSQVTPGSDPNRPPTVRDMPVTYIVTAVLLGSCFVALLWVSSYSSIKPTLAGFPFFYWYSILWLLINAATQILAYYLLVLRPRRRRRRQGVDR